MQKIIQTLEWKGPPFSVVLQKNDRDMKYVYTDTQRKFILKLEDMNRNNEGSENESKVLESLLHNPKNNLPRPLKYYKTDENINVSVMVNSGVSLDGKTFSNFFNETPTGNDFIMAVKSLVGAVYNLHDIGFIHRDITPGNVVYNRSTNQWTLIDFDFAVPFDYPQMHSEVIVNPKYDYIVHPWFKLDKDDYMFFDVPRLKKYMEGTHVMWYMLIDYYAVAKVLLFTFGLLMSRDDTYYHILNDENALDNSLKANFKDVNPMMKDYVFILYQIVGSFAHAKKLPNAVESWAKLLRKTGHRKTTKRFMNDSSSIKGDVGRLKRVKGDVRTFSLVNN